MTWTTIAVPKLIQGTGQNIAIGLSSTQNTTAFGTYTQLICINATGDCHFEIGTNPTATSASALLKSTDGPLLVGIAPGSKIAIIQDGVSTGNLNVSEWTY